MDEEKREKIDKLALLRAKEKAKKGFFSALRTFILLFCIISGILISLLTYFDIEGGPAVLFAEAFRKYLGYIDLVEGLIPILIISFFLGVCVLLLVYYHNYKELYKIEKTKMEIKFDKEL